MYRSKCMFYLGIEIIKILELEDKFLYIDNYYDMIFELYDDYEKYDNTNKSLLDSINDYIYNNIDKIKERLIKVIDE